MNRATNVTDPWGRHVESILSEQQADLLTRLGREAVPIHQAREYAAQELNLVAVRDAIEDQIMLAQPLVTEKVSPEVEQLQRQFVSLVLRFDFKVLEDLRLGTLLAFGVRLPVRPSSVATPIPPGLWYSIGFNMEDCTATGAQWSYKEVRVICVRSMGAPERRVIDRGLAILAANLEAEAGDGLQPSTAQAPPPWGGVTAAPTPPAGGAPDGDGDVAGGGRSATPAEEPSTHREDGGQSADHEQVPRLSPGPWSVMPAIKDELRRRAAAKLCLKTWANESHLLWRWAHRTFKRNEETKAADPPDLKWIRQALSNLYYELNPETPRPRRRRNKS